MTKSLFRLTLRMATSFAQKLIKLARLDWNEIYARVVVLNKFIELGRPHIQVIT